MSGQAAGFTNGLDPTDGEAQVQDASLSDDMRPSVFSPSMDEDRRASDSSSSDSSNRYLDLPGQAKLSHGNPAFDNEDVLVNKEVQFSVKHVKNGDVEKQVDEPEQPTAGEEKDKKEKKEPPKLVSLSQLFQFADWKDGMLMFIGSLAAMANGCTHPVSFIIFGKLISKFIDHAKQGTANKINIEEEMKTFAIYYVIIACCMLVFSYLQCAFWALAGVRQTQRIRTAFFEAIMRQEIGWFDVNESGGLTTRLSDDILKIQTGIGDKVGGSIQYMSMFFAGFGVGFAYGWKLTLVILSLSPALIICAAVMGKIMGTFTSREQTAYASAGAIAEEVLSSMRTVAAFGGEHKEIARYNEKLAVAEKAGIKKGFTLGATFGVFHIVIFSTYALAFWYGSKLVAEEKGFDGGDLLTVFFCVMIGAAQVGQASPNFEALNNARGAAYFVYEVIHRKSAINALATEGKLLEKLNGDISFEHIRFHYPSRPELAILDGFDLQIKSGSTVALVGESGCGKSTLVKLIQRFYDPDPDMGYVKVDSVDVRELNVQWLRSHIGVVSQEPVLFDMSVADNIRMGKPSATQEEIVDAAKMANCHNFIMDLPMNYNTNVGEGGAQLSGGQKQRVAIARALVRDPKILLLDEATSALDTESESIVQAALEHARRGRTTIIVAHRLSTVRNADVIVAIKNGRVAEQGTHEELMAKEGVYYELVMLQTLTEKEEHELEVSGSLLSEAEKEVLVEAKLIRSLSSISASSDKEVQHVKSLERAISARHSIRLHHQKSVEVKPAQQTKEKKKDEVEDEKLEPAPVLRILGYNKPEIPLMIIGSLFSAIVGAFPVAFAIIISELLEVFAQTDPKKLKEEATKWSLGFLALGLADAVGLLVSAWLFAIAGERLTRRMRLVAFTAMLRQDISYFDDPVNTTGHLAARLATDASNIQGAAATRLNIMVQVTVMGLAAIICAFIFSWILTLLILAFIPLLMIGGALQMLIFKNFAAEGQKMLNDATACATQAIMNVRTVASLGQERHFYAQFQHHVAKPYRKSLLKANILGITFGFSFANMMFANAAAFRLGGKLVQDGTAQFQDMFKVIFATTFGAMIAGQIASMAPDFMQAKVSAARIFKLLDRVPAIDAYSPEGVTKPDLTGEIRLEDVHFNYPARPDVPVLQGLSLNIPVGKTVALVGASGCGKSTSVGLLERFYNSLTGEILVDGVNIRDFNLKFLRSQIGLVSQEPVLFAKSIRDNILYGVDESSLVDPDKCVEQAAISANIDSFIKGLPKGYDTMVGEKGTLISGGQKQRIAIARALVRNPKIMLLDEATSALDSESEKVVQEALERAMQGRTSIVIAHRLSTIQNADMIAVIQGGRVVEVGTHHELIAKKGAYYLLNVAQL